MPDPASWKECMHTSEYLTRLAEENLQQIVDRFSQDELIPSSTSSGGGIDPLWARFKRAAINQISGGDATLSRYEIWANTVRDNIVAALERMGKRDSRGAKKLLIRAANSLSAFAEFQAHFDLNALEKHTVPFATRGEE